MMPHSSYENKSIFNNLIVCIGYPVLCSLTSTPPLVGWLVGIDSAEVHAPLEE